MDSLAGSGSRKSPRRIDWDRWVMRTLGLLTLVILLQPTDSSTFERSLVVPPYHTRVEQLGLLEQSLNELTDMHYRLSEGADASVALQGGEGYHRMLSQADVAMDQAARDLKALEKAAAAEWPERYRRMQTSLLDAHVRLYCLHGLVEAVQRGGGGLRGHRALLTLGRFEFSSL